MTTRLSNTLAALLFLAGALVLAHTLTSSAPETKLVDKTVAPEDMYVNLDALLPDAFRDPSTPGLSSNEIEGFALFVLSPAACPNVISEAVEFSKVIRGADIDMVSIALIVDEDSLRATHFLDVVRFPFPGYQVNPSPMVSQLSLFGQSSQSSQIAFVDAHTSRVFFRKLIGSYVTDNKYKDGVISKMLSAKESQNEPVIVSQKSEARKSGRRP